jgi:hypothetical protein
MREPLGMYRPAVVPAVSPLRVRSDRRPQINGDVGWQEDLNGVFASSRASVPYIPLWLSTRNSVCPDLVSSLVCYVSVSC